MIGSKTAWASLRPVVLVLSSRISHRDRGSSLLKLLDCSGNSGRNGAGVGLEVTGVTMGVADIGAGTVEGLGELGRLVAAWGEGDINTTGRRVGGAMGALELCTVVEV